MKVLHVSDLHIHPNRYEALDAAFQALAQVQADRIVITGDVYERNSHAFGGDIARFNRLVKSLGNVAPVIVIKGNHDFNEQHDLIRDTLYEQARYLDASGSYSDGPITWHVVDPADPGDPMSTLVASKTDGVNILLLHEPITGCATDSGHRLQGRYSATKLGADFDYVMAGDIHKCQGMCRNVWYPGSLVQKTRVEAIQHYALLWDTESKSPPERIAMPTVKVWVDIPIHDDTPPVLPKFDSARAIVYRYRNCSQEFLDSLQSGNPKPRLIDDNELELANVDINRTIAAQPLASEYDELAIGSRRTWRLLRLQWSNMFRYSGENWIDFRTLEGVTMLQGGNATGKSSVFNVLLVGLYGPIGGITTTTLLNNGNRNPGYVSVSYSTDDGCEVRVTRHIYRSGSDGIVMERNGTPCSRVLAEVYTRIKTDIGSYEDFTSIVMARQHRTGFAQSGTQRIGMLSKYLGLNDLDSMIKRVAADIRAAKEALSCLPEPQGIEDLELRLAQASEVDRRALTKRAADTAAAAGISFGAAVEVADVDAVRPVRFDRVPDPIRFPTHPSRGEIDAAVQKLQGLSDPGPENAADRVAYESTRGMSCPDGSAEQIVAEIMPLVRGTAKPVAHSIEHIRDRKSRIAELEAQIASKNDEITRAGRVLIEVAEGCECCARNNLKFGNAALVAGIRRDRDALVSQVAELRNTLSQEAAELLAHLRSTTCSIRKWAAAERHAEWLKRRDAWNSVEARTAAGVMVAADAAWRQHLAYLAFVAQQELNDAGEDSRVLEVQLAAEQNKAETRAKQETRVRQLEELRAEVKRTSETTIRARVAAINTVWNAKLADISDMRVHIEYSTRLTIVLTRGNNIAAESASGYERFALDISFRDAIMSIAQVPVPSFLMIDEGFACADAANRLRIREYLDRLGERYEWVLIVTHTSDMSVPKRLTIRVDGERSELHKGLRENVGAEFEASIQDVKDDKPVFVLSRGKYVCTVCDFGPKPMAQMQRHMKTRGHVTKYLA
jgi:predicted phosphodiesterase